MTMTRGIDRKIRYCKSNIHPTGHLPEHGIVPVEIVVVGQVDVKLGTPTVPVRGTGHTEVTNVVAERVIDLKRNGFR